MKTVKKWVREREWETVRKRETVRERVSESERESERVKEKEKRQFTFGIYDEPKVVGWYIRWLSTSFPTSEVANTLRMLVVDDTNTNREYTLETTYYVDSCWGYFYCDKMSDMDPYKICIEQFYISCFYGNYVWNELLPNHSEVIIVRLSAA